VIHQQAWATTNDGLQRLADQRRTIGPVLENQIERLLMFGVNRSAQLRYLRIFHNVPPHHLDILFEK
jgi:hypothetical protein